MFKSITIRKVCLKYLIFINSLVATLILLNACTKDDNSPAKLIDSSFKTLKLNTGIADQIIPIHAAQWSIAYVKDEITGKQLLDQYENPIAIDHSDSILVNAAWLKLVKTKDHHLKVNLLENFSDEPRAFIVGIQAANRIEDLHFIQTRGDDYELMEQDIQEIKDSREIHTDNQSISPITLTNYTNSVKKMDIQSIFKDIQYSSAFSSDSYGAFDWMNKSKPELITKEIQVADKTVWIKPVIYKKGITLENFIANDTSADAIDVPAHSSVIVSGEITYLERSSTYILSIKNSSSGNRFKVKGIWHQKIPLTSNTILTEIKH